ncbi:MAG: 3-isopropylmalate dehydratase small subunit [Candidatus Sumerlaeia bacterium]|nr:3-isopropylmalate dehydratase small subunit [Candidatus Sumerlaeia bacterium]
MRLRGRAIKYGDNIDTDAIIPARYLVTTDEKELAGHCMEDLDTDFQRKKRPGDIIVAGKNFGCGSSREHAPIAIKGSGIAGVVASSFARIFYRNAINIGLPIIECPTAVEQIQDGDELEIDLERGTLKNLTRGQEFSFPPLPRIAQEIFSAGGLMPFSIARQQKKSADNRLN